MESARVRVATRVSDSLHMCVSPHSPPPLWPLKCFFFFFLPLPYLNHAALLPPELSNPWVVDMA